jgi:hypothetical protein
VQQRQKVLPDRPAAVSAPTWRPRAQMVELGLAGAAVLSLVGLVAALGTGATQYRSVSTLALVPTVEAVDPGSAYQLDLISRGVILPTLAAALDASLSPAEIERQAGRPPSSELDVDIAQSRLGGALVVTVTTDTEQSAADTAAAAVTLATTQVAVLDTGYRVLGETGLPQPLEPVRRWLGWLFAVTLLGTAAGVLRLSRAKAARLEAARSLYLERQELGAA